MQIFYCGVLAWMWPSSYYDGLITQLCVRCLRHSIKTEKNKHIALFMRAHRVLYFYFLLQFVCICLLLIAYCLELVKISDSLIEPIHWMWKSHVRVLWLIWAAFFTFNINVLITQQRFFSPKGTWDSNKCPLLHCNRKKTSNVCFTHLLLNHFGLRLTFKGIFIRWGWAMMPAQISARSNQL